MSGNSDLKALYPFLDGEQQDSARLDAVLMLSVEEKARDSRETNARFFAENGEVLVAAAKARCLPQWRAAVPRWETGA
ncbi:hypothetical protein ACE103_10620 [Bradyrhizobium sp. ma5]|uniref:hypothetical protein n=1 Tax=Bradyrhizobium sp. ma5 TaxID=3344828 RepID=UPI0035D47755